MFFDQYVDEYINERKKVTSICIKKNTSVTDSNNQMD